MTTIARILLIVLTLGALSFAPAAPAQGQGTRTITIAHPGPIHTMDSPVTWFIATHWLTMLMGDCLIWRSPDLKGYVPQLAERWENTSPDRWRFFIRRNATFHNGEPINAETIKWNIDRIKARRDFLVNPQWGFVKEVVIVNEFTLDVITNGPKPYTEYDISYNGCNILPPRYIAQVGEREFARRPIGSGPFRLVEFREGERYVFEAWDGYWGGRPRGVDRIVYQVIPDQATQAAALLAGQVDLITNVPVTDIARVRAARNLKIVPGESGFFHNVFARARMDFGDMTKNYPGYQPTTMSKEIRQAVFHALDRATLAKVQGAAKPVLVRITCEYPEVPRKYCDEKNIRAAYNPERAKRLVRQAGFDPAAGKKPVVFFDAPAFQIGNEKEVAEAIKVQLEEVGFDVRLNILDNQAYTEQISRRANYRDLTMVSQGGSPSLVPLFYRCEWPKTGTQYTCNRNWQQWGDLILKEMDPKKRNAQWERWWDHYMDHATTITVHEIQRQYGMSSRIEWKPRADGWVTPRDVTVR